MPNLDFSIAERPIMDDACYYCTEPIREKHIRIKFEHEKIIPLHFEPCWELFVEGVNMINYKVYAGRIN